MNVLNLYAGLGGNRREWHDCHVTAVEQNPDIAAVYQSLYPDDTVIVGDAHTYLLEHYKEYDFIWTSPPCQSHSRIRYQLGVKARGTTKALYPDFTLYEEIVFLQTHAECPFVVENVKPYYTPFIPPTVELQRHLFWCNFPVTDAKFPSDGIERATVEEMMAHRGIDLRDITLKNKRQCLRNCVYPPLGAHIFNCMKESVNAHD